MRLTLSAGQWSFAAGVGVTLVLVAAVVPWGAVREGAPAKAQVAGAVEHPSAPPAVTPAATSGVTQAVHVEPVAGTPLPPIPALPAVPPAPAPVLQPVATTAPPTVVASPLPPPNMLPPPSPLPPPVLEIPSITTAPSGPAAPKPVEAPTAVPPARVPAALASVPSPVSVQTPPVSRYWPATPATAAPVPAASPPADEGMYLVTVERLAGRSQAGCACGCVFCRMNHFFQSKGRTGSKGTRTGGSVASWVVPAGEPVPVPGHGTVTVPPAQPIPPAAPSSHTARP